LAVYEARTLAGLAAAAAVTIRLLSFDFGTIFTPAESGGVASMWSLTPLASGVAVYAIDRVAAMVFVD